MTDQELREMLPFLCDHHLSGLNDVRVDALTRMLIACNDWVCTTGYGGPELRRRIADRIDALYHTIDRSSVTGLLRMYRLTKEATSALYGAKDEECSRLFHKFAGNLPEHPAPGEEIAAMQCIVYELADIAEGNTEFDYYAWFQKRCGRWIKQWNDKSGWNDLPTETALQRLMLLQDNACVFLDPSHDRAIPGIYTFYKERLALSHPPVPDDLPLLGAWYDLLRNPGILPYEPVSMKRITERLEAVANAAEHGSDIWYRAAGFVIMQHCAEQTIREGFPEFEITDYPSGQ